MATKPNYRVDFRKETEDLAKVFLGGQYDDYMKYRYNPKDYIAICIESPAYKNSGVRLSIYSDGQSNEVRLDKIKGPVEPKINLLPADLAELNCKYWDKEDIRRAKNNIIRELNVIRGAINSESN